MNEPCPFCGMPHCDTGIAAAAALMGKRGGSSRSEAKREAGRRCKWCGQPTLHPSGCCSTRCQEEFLGETRADYDEDERRPDTLDDGDEEADPDEEA